MLQNIKSFDVRTTNIMKLSHKKFYLHTTFISAPPKKSSGGWKNQHIFHPLSKTSNSSQNHDFSPIFNESHSVLGMSDCDVRHSIRKEIVFIFRFYFVSCAPEFFADMWHTAGTSLISSKTLLKRCTWCVPGVCI